MPELKTVSPIACLRRGFRLRQGSGRQVGRQAGFVIEDYAVPREPLRDEGPVGDHTGYYTLPEPYPASAGPKLRRGEGPSSTAPPSTPTQNGG